MIEFVNGNILDTDCDIICQQVNCKGVMGAGLAKQIRDRYPGVYPAYIDFCRSCMLGDVLFYSCPDGKIIANIFGQYGYGRNGVYTYYTALQKGLAKVRQFASDNALSVAIPYGIGCGLAGGDWSTVEKQIRSVFQCFPYTVKITKFV